MELDLTTFILEIINFLILIWLLKHFFYRPVMDIIQKRLQSIQENISQAEQKQTEAAVLKSDYENREQEWEKEISQARQQLQAELEERRHQILENLHQGLEQEREKARTLMQRENKAALEKLERHAIAQGLAFTSRLLSRLARPELEKIIIDMVLRDIENLGEEKKRRLIHEHSGNKGGVTIRTAYTLEEKEHVRLIKSLGALLEIPVKPEFEVDKKLIAGLVVTIGTWSLQASLAGELEYFSNMGPVNK